MNFRNNKKVFHIINGPDRGSFFDGGTYEFQTNIGNIEVRILTKDRIGSSDTTNFQGNFKFEDEEYIYNYNTLTGKGSFHIISSLS